MRGTASSIGTHAKSSSASITPVGRVWRDRAWRTTCPEDLMLLLSIDLLIALKVTPLLIIYERMKAQRGLLAPQ